MLKEVTELRANIPNGLRNLANAIESGEYDPMYLVWVIEEYDGIVAGSLGICSDGDAHLSLAKAQRYFEGCY